MVTVEVRLLHGQRLEVPVQEDTMMEQVYRQCCLQCGGDGKHQGFKLLQNGRTLDPSKRVSDYARGKPLMRVVLMPCEDTRNAFVCLDIPDSMKSSVGAGGNPSNSGGRAGSPKPPSPRNAVDLSPRSLVRALSPVKQRAIEKEEKKSRKELSAAEYVAPSVSAPSCSWGELAWYGNLSRAQQPLM